MLGKRMMNIIMDNIGKQRDIDMKIKIVYIVGPVLDWAAGRAGGYDATNFKFGQGIAWGPSTNWLQGGPIIEREEICISTTFYNDRWMATQDEGPTRFGPTPLIAAMRCYVASKLGDEIEIPKELL